MQANGVSEGDRTLNHWSHSPALYQLSYAHHRSANHRLPKSCVCRIGAAAALCVVGILEDIPEDQVACLEGFEPPTRGLEGRRSSPAELQAAGSVYPSHLLKVPRLRASDSKVGAPRFELGTPCAQGRCATRLRYAPSEAPKRQQSVRSGRGSKQAAQSKRASRREALAPESGCCQTYQLNATLPSARRLSRSPPKLSQCSSSSALLTFKPNAMWSLRWKLAPTSTTV